MTTIRTLHLGEIFDNERLNLFGTKSQVSSSHIEHHLALIIFTRAVANIVERAHACDRFPLRVGSRGASGLLIGRRHETQPVFVVAARGTEEVKLAVGGNHAVEGETGAIALQVILAAFILTLGAGAQLGPISREVLSWNIYRSVGTRAVAPPGSVEGDALKRICLPSGRLEVHFGVVAFRVCFHALLDCLTPLALRNWVCTRLLGAGIHDSEGHGGHEEEGEEAKYHFGQSMEKPEDN